jgi:dienelactone hydrolase
MNIRVLAVAAVFATLLWTGFAAAQEVVHFPSLEDNGPGQPSTMLDGYLFRPAGQGAHPAVVGLHGCSGMFSPATGGLTTRDRAWADELTRAGFVVLLVDSLGPRQHGEMCSIGGFDLAIYRKRPKDAYGALWYLQSQPFVRGDRIAAIGWSQGGGVVLMSIPTASLGRPASLPQGDFRAAVAFYPGSCNDNRLPAGWTSTIPLLVLQGEADVWTPLGPCKAFVEGAVGRGSRIEMQVYPGAYHGFDTPNQERRELPKYVTGAGVVPIIGTDPAGRADAMARVPAFLARYLGN